ncbi:MAG: CoA ligase @ Long-chain fatty-acid-CoA ligase, Mycobacterial subgroup FadD4 [uncultured Acidimicrobiales bacterium]|uniref:CoA ligase @ Long-chain fatty-acid-CoA ligase, Mycobacterial subgroup FadD4 n=1 Tax=uncultured Acidimicrobiales bacterium TaxID=310071 RepID=A0A6J4J7S4_9ACTN|nr:MAG: CoA ligase @ Long-chain fatty-acid-CoA ligase, Mycobacterial subgroup FadD4 [uncultured Acidimicrobiales bacterium]
MSLEEVPVHPGVHAATNPDRAATIMAGSGEVVTYGRLEARSNQVAHLLRSLGLGWRDGIALCLENSARYHEVCWGAQRSGLYYTAASTRLTAGELGYIVDDCGARVIILSYEQRHLAAPLLALTPRVVARYVVGGTVEGYESFEQAVAGQPTHPVADEAEGADMLYSSGTTGRPKGVKPPIKGKPLGELNGLVLLCRGLYGFGQDTRYLSPAPLYHAAPLRFSMTAHRLGATVVVMEHFDPVRYLALVDEHDITHTQLVPTMFVRMLKLDPAVRRACRLTSLRCAIHAAAPCPVPVKEQMIEWWGPIIHEYYAGTEGNGFCAISSEEWLAHRGSVGRNLLGPIHILDDDGNEVDTGQVGTVYFEGGPRFEYHNDPEKTELSRTERGWSTLGDIGRLDEDGYLYLTDRKADMIISGGVNVYPQEAENVLTLHPKVADVAVFGIPDEDLGELVKAVVQPVDGTEVDRRLEQELIAYCRERLSPVKCPRSIDFRSELPRHPTGKLYKRLIRDEYWMGNEGRLV